MLNYTPVYRKRQKDSKLALTFRGRCFFVIFLPSFYVLFSGKWRVQNKRIKEGGSKWLDLTWEVAPKDRCRELQSEFCDGLRITSRRNNRFLYRADCNVKQLYYSNAGCKVAITLCTVHGFMIFRNKSEPTFMRWSKGIGKVVIYKALHKGDVNYRLA